MFSFKKLFIFTLFFINTCIVSTPLAPLTPHFSAFASRAAMITPLAIRHNQGAFSTLSRFIKEKFFKSSTGRMIKTIQENPQDRRLVAHIFLQNICINNLIAGMISYGCSTNFSTTCALQLAALGLSIRSTAKNYTHFLENQALKREILKVYDQVKSTERSLTGKITDVETHLSSQLQTTHSNLNTAIQESQKHIEQNLLTIIQQTEANLNTHLDTSTTALMTQLGVTETTLLSHVKGLQEQSAINTYHISQLLSQQKELNNDQKRVLEVIMKTLPQNHVTLLEQKFPFNATIK